LKTETNTILLGKLLAEVYRLQKVAGVSTADDAKIYALKNGFETAISEELESIGYISAEQVKHVGDVLNSIWIDKEKIKAFKGFYDIEPELANGGVDRYAAIQIITYFSATGQFADVISKMDSSNSPGECRTFKIDNWNL